MFFALRTPVSRGRTIDTISKLPFAEATEPPDCVASTVNVFIPAVLVEKARRATLNLSLPMAVTVTVPATEAPFTLKTAPVMV